MDRRLAPVLVGMALIASCSPAEPEPESESECGSVGSTYREAISDEGSMKGQATVEGEMLFVPSQQVEGVFFIAARVNGSLAVWATDRDPQGNDLGLIIVANEAARQHSILGIDVPRDSRAAEELALDDTDGIAAAEACVQT
jgi:hypothetical protein